MVELQQESNKDRLEELESELAVYNQERFDNADDPEYLELVEEELKRISSEIDAIRNSSRERINGATFDYDFEVKQKWRQSWFDFIAENTDESNRGEMKVLCLPGRLCLEIPGYLKLGFSSENIIGVEGDKKVRDEFEDNAKKYGIQTLFGRLEEVVPSLDVPLDVVSLDFTGLCTESVLRKVVSKLYLNKRALVLTNFLGARENKNLQELYHLRRAEMDLLPHLDHLNRINDLRKDFEVDEQPANPLSDIRNNVIRSYVESETGRFRPDNWLYPASLKSLFRKQIDKDHPIYEHLIAYKLEEALKLICDYLKLVLAPYMQFPEQLMFILYYLCVDALLGIPVTMNIKKYKYVSRNGSPFVSDMFVHEVPKEIYEKCQRTVNFIFNFLTEFVNTRSLPEINVVKKGIPRNGQLSNQDKLRFVSGGTNFELPIRIFLRDIVTYKDLLLNVPYRFEKDYPEIEIIEV